jgi:hypothetical protein
LCGIVYYISAAHETIAFHALYLPKVDHKLQFRRELIVPSCGRNNTYAPQPKTLILEMSGLSPVSASKGVRHLR